MKPKQKQFITMWDTLGFECIVDMTSWERAKLLQLIKGEESELRAPVNFYHLLLRAKANPQRFPEIWSFTTTDDITQEDLIEISKDDPQMLVDMIRDLGNNLYTAPKQKAVIQ
jgi:hypothetical protein